MDVNNFEKQMTIPGGNAQEDATPVKIPKQIGPYKIDTLLEKGGMSILYLASHPDTQKPIVIKVLEPKFLSRPDLVKRFLDEVKIISLPDNPHIVKLFDHGKWEGGLYIAMEFIEGISLRQYLLKTHIPLRRALEIVIDIAYALCHLHTHGIIHRDLKPENVLITISEEVKVIDFGIAQLLTEQPDPNAPPIQRIIGTPVYMSPEQRTNPDNVSYPTDIYSLGIILYELVLGKLSYGKIVLNLMPPGIKNIVAKSLQRDEKKRYQDIVDFITDINEYLDSKEMQNKNESDQRDNALSQTILQIKTAITSQSAPKWPNLLISIGKKERNDTCVPLYDFHKIAENQFGILMGKCLNDQTEGLFYTTTVRGMYRSLIGITTKPKDLISKLNQQIYQDPIKQKFSLIYLFIDLEKNLFESFSCGNCPLYLISDKTIKKVSIEAPPLGEEEYPLIKNVHHSLKQEDYLLISSTQLPENLLEQFAKIDFKKCDLKQSNNDVNCPEKSATEEKCHLFMEKIEKKISKSFAILLIKKLTLE